MCDSHVVSNVYMKNQHEPSERTEIAAASESEELLVFHNLF